MLEYSSFPALSENLLNTFFYSMKGDFLLKYWRSAGLCTDGKCGVIHLFMYINVFVLKETSVGFFYHKEKLKLYLDIISLINMF
jgi:hypothetical protein